MNQKLIAHIDHGNHGIVVKALTDGVKDDISNVGSVHIDDLNMKGVPKEEGLYMWEGVIQFDDDDTEYRGVWRKATSKDLIEAKLINE